MKCQRFLGCVGKKKQVTTHEKESGTEKDLSKSCTTQIFPCREDVANATFANACTDRDAQIRSHFALKLPVVSKLPSPLCRAKNDPMHDNLAMVVMVAEMQQM